MMKSRSSQFVTVKPSRHGATLTEVLMAILIMSIGIVSVCSLFPISIISSIRATQLTNGRILRDNVNELVRTYPNLVAPPVIPGIGNWRGEWQPNTSYAPGDYVIPRLNKRALFPDPYFALKRVASGQTTAIEPDWLPSSFLYTELVPTTNNSLAVWQVVQIPHYVIDPHGFFRSQVVYPGRFGGIDSPILPLRTPSPAGIPPGNEMNATKYFTSPDSWSVLVQEYPTQFEVDVPMAGRTTVHFPGTVDLTNVSTDPNYSRVIFTRTDGAQTATRIPAAGTSGSQLVVDSIPSAFTQPASTGMARVETFSPRYTYFLTVQNRGAESPPRLSCAVVFNRRLSADAEHPYAANFGNASFDSVASVMNSNLLSDQVFIAWDNSEPEPFLKVGAYLLDARAVVFYRIVAVNKVGNSATISLNRPVEAMTYNNSSNETGLAIIMPGILHVYDVE